MLIKNIKHSINLRKNYSLLAGKFTEINTDFKTANASPEKL